MKYEKTNVTGLVVDSQSGAILNTDEGEWERYKAERNKALEYQQLKAMIMHLAERVKKLEENKNV